MDSSGVCGRILSRGVQLDNEKRYTEALVCYQEGLQILVDHMTGESDATKKVYLRSKVEGYMGRAEQIKKYVKEQKDTGKFHEQLQIQDDSTGHSYNKLFGRFLDEEVVSVGVEDPYIRAFHQCQNFLRLCELLVVSCSSLKEISLTTSHDGERPDHNQMQWLQLLRDDLSSKYKVTLAVSYSNTLHDRRIVLSTGWVIKIGRGLDLYKATDNKFSLGCHNLDLRRCHETQVDIFHMRDVKKL